MTRLTHPLLDPPPELVKFAADSGIVQCRDDEKTPQAVLDAMTACGSDLASFSPLFDSWKLEHSQRRGRSWFNEVSDVFVECIEKDHVDIARYMLQGGFILHADDIVQALELHRFELLELMLDGEHGYWDVNQMESKLWPAVLCRVLEDDVCVRWLLDYGADPNARCAVNLTPLSDAVRLAPISIINLLFDHGGDVTKGELLHHAMDRDNDNATMLQVITLLLDKGAPINRNMYEDDELGMQMCTQRSMTPLHYAAVKNLVDIARLLVHRGANVHKLDNAGVIRLDGKLFTPIEYAGRWKSWETYEYLSQFESKVEIRIGSK